MKIKSRQVHSSILHGFQFQLINNFLIWRRVWNEITPCITSSLHFLINIMNDVINVTHMTKPLRFPPNIWFQNGFNVMWWKYSNICAQALLVLLNTLRIRDNMLCKPRILYISLNSFNIQRQILYYIFTICSSYFAYIYFWIPECPTLEPPCNGFFIEPQLNPKPGDVLTYGCLEGFEVDGETTRICQDDYTWEGMSPCCVKTTCKRMYLLLLLLLLLLFIIIVIIIIIIIIYYYCYYYYYYYY